MKGKRIAIKRGDPQPLDCQKCESKQGYQVADKLVTDFVDFYFPTGEREGGAYGDYQRVINEGKTAYCMNCGERLRFKIEP